VLEYLTPSNKSLNSFPHDLQCTCILGYLISRYIILVVPSQPSIIFKTELLKNLDIPVLLLFRLFMENLFGPGLEQGRLALPLSHSSILHKTLLGTLEFSALAQTSYQSYFDV
jgi:hypothetical protein